jgi:hypothetical protein
MRTRQSLMACAAVPCLLLLFGCAAPPRCPEPLRPPKELLVPPPPPGAVSDRLEQILEKGQAPTSGPS